MFLVSNVLHSKMSSVDEIHNSWYETLRNQALERNDRSVATWLKYKEDLEVTKSLLSLLPQKMKHDVMVPIGGKALMRGEIVHTNEFLVNLGETWFATRTAYQTREICDRRIKTCDEMLEKLKKERELIVSKQTLPAEQEAFGSEERPEIVEYVTEEENEEWNRQHRIREKQYRQQLAELRKKEKKPIETEEDLWKHLDELELQEELEDELNRLNSEYNGEDEEEEDYEDNPEVKSVEEQNIEDSKVSVNKSSAKTKVVFEDDLNSADTEPLRLEIKHSDHEPPPSDCDQKETITSPADIYDKYIKSLNRTPLSILKNNVNHSKNSKTNSVQFDETIHDDNHDEEEYENVSTGVQLNDVVERCVSDVKNSQKIPEKANKKVSKFKSVRTKN